MNLFKRESKNGGRERSQFQAARIAATTLCFFGCSCLASTASASTFFFAGTSSDSHPVSGSVDFTLNAGADTVTIKLKNTTLLTNDAGELLTGIDFTLGGLTPSMSSDTGIQRTVDGNGAFTDTGSAQNLSWSLASLGGGTFQLNFTPDSADSIIGPPNGGNYAAANGSIKGNTGHNPFAAELAQFVLNVPNLENNSPVIATVFRYGTGLDPANGTITHAPEPATAILLLGLIWLLAVPRCLLNKVHRSSS
jgi:hypothetical protein